MAMNRLGKATTVDWSRYKTIRLETRKRDGTWVATPVSLVVRDDRLFFRTYKQSGKAKRLLNFSAVRLAPCSFLGKPKGDPVEGKARLLDEVQSATTRRLIRRRHPVLHGVLVPLAHRVMRYDTQHYELTIGDAD
jgi:PPOX class probable F420-dependent enzyme